MHVQIVAIGEDSRTNDGSVCAVIALIKRPVSTMKRPGATLCTSDVCKTSIYCGAKGCINRDDFYSEESGLCFRGGCAVFIVRV